MQEKKKARAKAIRARKKRNQKYLARLTAFLVVILVSLIGFVSIRFVVRKVTGDETAMETPIDEKVVEIFTPKVKQVYVSPKITQEYITPNEFSRPQEALLNINSVFVHYTANANTTAEQNRSYFDGLAQSQITSASAHFIIGYNGEILQCIPDDEIAYAVKGRNYDSVSIECCYQDESGVFTQATYESLIELVAYLLGKYDLSVKDVLRHYDEGGKNCPKYYVENEGAWKQFLTDLNDYIQRYGVYEDEMPLEIKQERERRGLK